MDRGSDWQIEVIEPVHQIISQIKLYEITFFPTHQTAVLPMPD